MHLAAKMPPRLSRIVTLSYKPKPSPTPSITSTTKPEPTSLNRRSKRRHAEIGSETVLTTSIERDETPPEEATGEPPIKKQRGRPPGPRGPKGKAKPKHASDEVVSAAFARMKVLQSSYRSVALALSSGLKVIADESVKNVCQDPLAHTLEAEYFETLDGLREAYERREQVVLRERELRLAAAAEKHAAGILTIERKMKVCSFSMTNQELLLTHCKAICGESERGGSIWCTP